MKFPLVTLAAILALGFGSVQVSAATDAGATTLKAGSHLACVLRTTIDSAGAKRGDQFELRVVDPRYPQLQGSTIVGHITRVKQPGGMRHARIDFLFDSITFASGSKNELLAYVVASNVVHKTGMVTMTAPAAVSPLTGEFTPKPSTIAWQMHIGATPPHASPTGGVIYASQIGAPVIVSAGTPVTLELAGDLTPP